MVKVPGNFIVERWIRGNTETYFTVRGLAEMLNVSRSVIYKVLDELRTNGYVFKRTRRWGINWYRLISWPGKRT